MTGLGWIAQGKALGVWLGWSFLEDWRGLASTIGGAEQSLTAPIDEMAFFGYTTGSGVE